MSSADLEISTFLGQPVELYEFAYGVDVWRYTSADAPYTFQGVTYQPVPLLRQQITVNNEEGTGNLDITLQRNDPVANMFVGFMPTMTVRIIKTHRNAPDSIAVFIGTVNSTKWTDATLVLTCLPTTQALRRAIPAILYQVQCNHVLFSQSSKYGRGASTAMEQTGCNAVKNNFAVNMRVASVSTDGTGLICPEAAGFADYYFGNGWAERSNGEIRWIANHDGENITLMQRFPDLAPNETIVLVPGCDHTPNANGCKKFNNLVNYNGFFYWPMKNPFTVAINR